MSIVAELLFVIAVFALALVIVPTLLALGGSALWTLLVHETPESYLSDPAARRALLRG
jgi:hypothetical protein